MERINDTIRIKAIETIISFIVNFNFFTWKLIETIKSFRPKASDYIELFGLPISLSNSKVPYIILNITSAYDCMSYKKGLCLANWCYAKNNENRYLDCYSFRVRQEIAWDKLTSDFIGMILLAVCYMFDTLVIRFQESGDLRNQNDVNKLYRICSFLSKHGITCYTYSARYDLDFTQLMTVCTIHISNEKESVKHNLPYTRIIKVKGYRQLTADQKFQVYKSMVKSINKNGKNEILCPGNCSKCKACLTTRYNIVFIEH